MTSLAFIIGMLILGICAVGAAFIISGAITGAAAASKESVPQSLQQPMLSFFTEFDAADYLGISLNELDYMRGEGMLDETFVAVTSMEQTGEEEYYAMEDGLEVIKLRPIMSPVTRFLFNRQLLDERMLQLIKEGKHVNPTRAKGSNNGKQNKPNKSNGQKKNNENRNNENRNNENRNGNQKKNSENKPERRDDDSTKIYNGKKNGERDNNSKHSNNEKRTDRSDNDNSKSGGKHSSITTDDDFFSKGAKGEHSRNNSKPGISYEDDSSDTKVVDLVSSSYFDD